MDLDEEMEKIRKQKKRFNILMGECTHAIIYDVRHPIKKSKHKKTIYYHFDAKVITKDRKPIPPARHTLQLPAKTVVYQLYDMLKRKEMLDNKEVTVTIIKKDTYNYDITIY